jgi:hypothetical protein
LVIGATAPRPAIDIRSWNFLPTVANMRFFLAGNSGKRTGVLYARRDSQCVDQLLRKTHKT